MKFVPAVATMFCLTLPGSFLTMYAQNKGDLCTGWHVFLVTTSCWLGSDSSGSCWTATVATYCPGRMAEHSISKSTGGFAQLEWSPCPGLENVLVQRLAKFLFPGCVYFCLALPGWCLAKQKNFSADLCPMKLSDNHCGTVDTGHIVSRVSYG